VCERRVPLVEAQRAIARNWIAAVTSVKLV
jgi:hypothetical protein